MFKVLIFFLDLLSRLPLGLLYMFSDLLAPLVYHLFRYRRKVVRKNLVLSFPEKEFVEIKKIERKFYRYFCDLFIETIYQLNMSEAEMRRRVTFVNTDLITEQYAKGKSVMMFTAHYGNWEWLASLSLILPKDKPARNVYKKLSSYHFNQFMFELRKRFGSLNIEMQDTFRELLNLKHSNTLATFGMISDQSPVKSGIRHWMPFLNQDTPVMVGAEQLARKFDYPVMFGSCTRIKRGYYRCEFMMLAEHPKLSDEYEITENYMRLLEKKIEQEPAYWLWSHNRWKNSRPIKV